MQPFQAATAGRLLIAVPLASLFARIRAGFAALVRRAHVEDAIAASYEGRGWCDETERGLTDDIANWRQPRF